MSYHFKQCRRCGKKCYGTYCKICLKHKKNTGVGKWKSYRKRKQTLIATITFLILISINGVYAFICDDTTNPEEIPCTVVTPTISCINATYNLTNLTNNHLIIIEGNMTQINSTTYNFTLNQGIGDYGIILCDGSTSTIRIGYEANFEINYIYLIGFIMFLILLFLGYYLDDLVFKFCAGAISIVISIILFTKGYAGINTYLIYSIAVIFLGIGMFYILKPSLKEEGTGD